MKAGTDQRAQISRAGIYAESSDRISAMRKISGMDAGEVRNVPFERSERGSVFQRNRGTISTSRKYWLSFLALIWTLRKMKGKKFCQSFGRQIMQASINNGLTILLTAIIMGFIVLDGIKLTKKCIALGVGSVKTEELYEIKK